MDTLQPPIALPFEIKDLFHISDRQDEIPWTPYKKGVEIFRLYGDGITGPTAALLRYREAGEVPIHEHPGYEHIFVLSGSQEDDHGVFNARNHGNQRARHETQGAERCRMHRAGNLRKAGPVP